MSYAKVRALTRIATADTEAGLAELAAPMTANQLERFARAHRQVSSVDDQAARIRRRMAFRFEDDGSLSGTFHLPPLAGAVLLKALRAAAADLEPPDPAAREHPHPADRQHPDPANHDHPDPAGPEYGQPGASEQPAGGRRRGQAFPRKRVRAGRWRRRPPAWPMRPELAPFSQHIRGMVARA